MDKMDLFGRHPTTFEDAKNCTIFSTFEDPSSVLGAWTHEISQGDAVY
jgi:hypothetical protein